MAATFDTSSSTIRITRFLCDGKVRFVVQDRKSLVPRFSYSLYEAYLSRKTDSHNSVQATLSGLRFLATWADHSNIHLDGLLLQGDMLESRQVNAFGAWLRLRGKVRSKQPERLSNAEINKALHCASAIFVWFARQYAVFEGRANERSVKLELHIEAIRSLFKDQRLRVRQRRVATDLSEIEILAIEQFLKPEKRQKANPMISSAEALRDYLIWRLTIEFGLREGEVLALRLDDCPHRDKDSIRIVRIEDRGRDYSDPRGKYAPRPKTLSRDLGFILKDSPIPKLIREYTTRHRHRKVLKYGRENLQPILDTPAFLILSHRNHKGTPLSISSMQDLAAKIRRESGVDHFHWHLARHAFFNRAYSAVVDLKESDTEKYKDRLRDLVYWGGWEDEKSLQLYVNRARKERAEMALGFYQAGINEWKALQ